MKALKNFAVYCGSSPGLDPYYTTAAYELGEYLGTQQIGLVYGGASVGLMGAVANGCLSKNGSVTGVLPKFLKKKEIEHSGLRKLILVDTMHERKRVMFDLSDAFIVLPGGLGTMEEFFEIITWSQLGLHNKPIIILNWLGFYNPLLALIQNMVSSGFLKKENAALVQFLENSKDLLVTLQNYSPSKTEKWLSEGTV
ncbi:TIGR00730 family Rossman fold protein [Leptospira sp. 2 VSF19]|uniref:Cytokinin riboside 5'-monophosphate phosphoribohydrolase n=1 Tax=Leptospira soteropolitanensis TaxID=2950025 RepID=A0AAW5VHM8_9LEPT|nr:TIGR00730 family Rossman fold protein [Leptospira soteropolitanensis]MCW7491160.1 TIGR00730 family Rossman fold protein [Leptospira soteropolitanensis]MCW7498744.1 TIGR00730 family Rossman fold protein [Leptospira soteropolitanensis]MCW7521663.1 TIGR00730 family Rossman fold protein [Leptospira soteropolitanensis]MCW7524848.1 TIGR00730 family Rossman fold protein [Leptospira soteropolitanensis]MCW7528715.1 TIGR00730 family Rossman fold protein [Leptospira soteropolitanensis]